ncbi:hypothetical protein AOLI_G00185680 [Acnodon oligacanthus]
MHLCCGPTFTKGGTHTKNKQRTFLEELGSSLVKAYIEQRERVPRDPATPALVRQLQSSPSTLSTSTATRRVSAPASSSSSPASTTTTTATTPLKANPSVKPGSGSENSFKGADSLANRTRPGERERETRSGAACVSAVRQSLSRSAWVLLPLRPQRPRGLWTGSSLQDVLFKGVGE